MILEESKSVYLGNPAAGFYFNENGDVFVPDAGSNRLVSFTGQGRLLGVFGRQGAGPGEFRGIGYVGFAGALGVLQDDYMLRRINIYDSSARPLGHLTYKGRLTGLEIQGDTLWLGLPDRRTGLAVAKIPLTGHLPADSTAAVSANMIRLPSEYSVYSVLRSWGEVRPIVWTDTLAIAYGGLEFIVRYLRSDTALDTVRVPVCRRQGSPQELLDRWFRIPGRTAKEQEDFIKHAETKISGLLGFWRLSDGKFLVWYVDPYRDPGRILRSVAFLSVLSPDFRRACVDAELTAPGSGRARLNVRDDQIFLLDQVVDQTDSGPHVRTVLRRYSIDTEHCNWLSTIRRPE